MSLGGEGFCWSLSNKVVVLFSVDSATHLRRNSDYAAFKLRV